MSKDYMLNKIAKCGDKITILGKNISAIKGIKGLEQLLYKELISKEAQ